MNVSNIRKQFSKEFNFYNDFVIFVNLLYDIVNEFDRDLIIICLANTPVDKDFETMKIFPANEISERCLQEFKLFNDRYSDLHILTGNTNNAHSIRSSKELEQGPKLKLNVKKMKNILLQNHNKYRELHNAHPLKHSNGLEKTAQAWAQVLSEALVLTYSPESSVYAENCAEIRNPFQFETEEITDLWYSQERNYDYENFNHAGPVDQFCVLIWKETVKVGFGIAISSDLRVFVVAHYSPPGLTTNFEENVKPPKNYKKPSTESKPFVPVEPTSKSFKAIKKDELHDFHIDALGKLNNFRILHGVPALKLNDELCLSAFDQAKRCATNKMILTNNDRKVGETFLELKIESFSITGGLSPRHWYAESVGYNYSKEPETDQYYNFTQLVWKNSQEMGIGVAASIDGVLFIIGKYLPPGNIQNQYLDNVLLPNEKYKVCHCGCGYITPACVQDLKTTIIGKLPSMLSTAKSKDSKIGLSVRSFSVIENKAVQNASLSVKESQVAKTFSLKEQSLTKDLFVQPSSESEIAIADEIVQSIKTKETLKSALEVNTGSNIESIPKQEQSIEELKGKKSMVKEIPNKTIKESIGSKKSEIGLETARSKIESIRNKDLSTQNSINTRQITKEITQSQNDSIKPKQSDIVSERLRSKIESTKGKDTSQTVNKNGEISTKLLTNASLKESVKPTQSSVTSEIIRSKIESTKGKDTSQTVNKNGEISTKLLTNASLKESVKPTQSSVTSEIIRSKIESVKGKDTSQTVNKKDEISTKLLTNIGLKESLKPRQSSVRSDIVRSKIEKILNNNDEISNKPPANTSFKESVKLNQSSVTSEIVRSKIESVQSKELSNKGVTNLSQKESQNPKSSEITPRVVSTKDDAKSLNATDLSQKASIQENKNAFMAMKVNEAQITCQSGINDEANNERERKFEFPNK